MKIKIGILGTRGIPNNYGGFEQFAQQISQALCKRGYEVFVYNSSHHPYKQEEWKGVHIIHCKDWENQLGTAGQFFYDLNCIKDARKRNFDILFHFGYSSDSFWWRRWPANCINIVNMDGLEWKRTKYNKITRKFLQWAEALAARHANIMIADSPAIRDYIFTRYHKTPVLIPYGAQLFSETEPGLLKQFMLLPHQYFLVIARTEPENNIEMVIQGYLDSHRQFPLVVIGGLGNKFGKYLGRKYNHPNIKFTGSLYDESILNNLRYFSAIYFHGHSVGGTNPSLLEAMACNCNIAAHDNLFNKAVLGNEAGYFSSAKEVTSLINTPKEICLAEEHRSLNKKKISTIYDPEIIANAYGELIRMALQ